MIRYNATKEDIKRLKSQLRLIDAKVDQLENSPVDSVEDYCRINSMINNQLIKRMAVEDHLSRILKKGFSKNSPEASQIHVPNLINEIEI